SECPETRGRPFSAGLREARSLALPTSSRAASLRFRRNGGSGHATARALPKSRSNAPRTSPAWLHPEHAEFRVGDRSVERGGMRERQYPARFGRLDNAVVPEPCRGEIRIALLFVLMDNRRLERRLFFST